MVPGAVERARELLTHDTQCGLHLASGEKELFGHQIALHGRYDCRTTWMRSSEDVKKAKSRKPWPERREPRTECNFSFSWARSDTFEVDECALVFFALCETSPEKT
jgi:hypothetical protein